MTALFCDFGDFNTQELLPSNDDAIISQNKKHIGFASINSSPQIHKMATVSNESNQEGPERLATNTIPSIPSGVDTPLSTPSSVTNLTNFPVDKSTYGMTYDTHLRHLIASENPTGPTSTNPNEPTTPFQGYHNFNPTPLVNHLATSTVSSNSSQSFIKPVETSDSAMYFRNQQEQQNLHLNPGGGNIAFSPSMMPRPIPFTPVQAAPPPLPKRADQLNPNLSASQTLFPSSVPFLPPKQHQPPPYRPPPVNSITGLSSPGPMQPIRTTVLSNNQMLSPTNRLLMMPPIEEDVSYMSQEPLLSQNSKSRHTDSSTKALSAKHDSMTASLKPNKDTEHDTRMSASNALSNSRMQGSQGIISSGLGCGGLSDGGGSHDSHNDSGYCIGSSSTSGRFGSGGPSPSLSGTY